MHTKSGTVAVFTTLLAHMLKTLRPEKKCFFKLLRPSAVTCLESSRLGAVISGPDCSAGATVSPFRL
jgi:hypothetical protein